MSLCTDALHWDLLAAGRQAGKKKKKIHVQLFSKTIDDTSMKLSMMVVFDEGFPKLHSFIT